MTQAHIHITDAVTVVKFLAFNQAAIDGFKSVIPAGKRKWDAASKAWTVAPSASKAAYACLVHAFGKDNVVKVDARGAQKQQQKPAAPAGKQATWAEQMFAALPEHLHEKAFKALVKALHPDTGGDTVAMQQLNGAHSKIKK